MTERWPVEYPRKHIKTTVTKFNETLAMVKNANLKKRHNNKKIFTIMTNSLKNSDSKKIHDGKVKGYD